MVLTLVLGSKVTSKVLWLGSVGALLLADWKRDSWKETSEHTWLHASTGSPCPQKEPCPSSLPSLAKEDLSHVVLGPKSLKQMFLLGEGPQP